MRACIISILAACSLSAASQSERKVRMSWGHDAPAATDYYIRLVPGPGVRAGAATGVSLETGEVSKDGVWQTRAGAQDIDGIDFIIGYDVEAPRRIDNLHITWSDLISTSDADTSRRLMQDPAFRLNSRKLTVQMDPQGTRGFSVTVDQLLEQKAIFVPSLHVYLTTGDRPVPFEEHMQTLKSWMGRRILDEVQREPEATYDYYASRWEDMGSPSYVHPQQPRPGHIVALTWDSAIPKFGIDRGAGVWNDYGNPDRFQFWYSFGDLTSGIASSWKKQSLHDGLPVITTVFEKEGVRYEVEQFAYPLDGPPRERRGDIGMVLMQKVRLIELEGKQHGVQFTISQRRQFPAFFNSSIEGEREGHRLLFRLAGRREVLFTIDGPFDDAQWSGVRDYQRDQKRLDVFLTTSLEPRGTREFIVKLPSPMVEPADAEKLIALDYTQSREQTIGFWSNWVERGAQFRVPEKAVNDLFRAALWHALRLPRRHGGSGPDVRIDLPYSNFAYSQTGTPWPVNQAVYVDYMLYDLRGYHSVSAEELLAQYRNNQEANGHVAGYANWVVYTPSMLYSVAQHYLLSGDRETFEKLLPASMKALDWCLEELRKAARASGHVMGLVRGPLNDGTGDGVWAFNQAYMYAGLEMFGRALERAGHARTAECRRAAQTLREAIQRGFQAAAMNSPLVPLRDRTWVAYVPCEARTFRRLIDDWYATDVDTGAVHMIRLKAVDAGGPLADSLLHDHEDNLYYKGWGIANEPVYNQQATAYLLRDDPKAVIRAFYSYMASAFSHSTWEPVEHRWTHGQYFGPPSTDGAWFDLYRNMLIHERDDGALVIGLATPRAWLKPGNKIEIERAPTYYGPVSARIQSGAAPGSISAEVEMPTRATPDALLVRLRHPEEKRMRSVTVNGQPWKDFDPDREWVRISKPSAKQYRIQASY
ncbi:MAG TPA: hypothetical protein VFQ79_10045 [Bryobacteraceae bacterium]|nr:hypothetical protein [Bryobacteraceae bacterium]